MSNKRLSGSIALTKLTHAKVVSKKGAECLMIPIEANYLEVDDNGAVYLPINVNYQPDGDKFGQNGFVSKTIGSKAYKAADQTQKDKWKADQDVVTPILGSIKDWGQSSGASANSGAVTTETAREDDDLPF